MLISDVAQISLLPSFRPDILALFVYAILLIMWLKFLVIWRLFRFWALCDGVEPPENMQVRERLHPPATVATLETHERARETASREKDETPPPTTAGGTAQNVCRPSVVGRDSPVRVGD